MEKNLAEHSGSFARKADDDTGNATHSPVPESADNFDAKPDTGETEKAADSDHVHGEQEAKENKNENENEKEKEKEEKKEEEKEEKEEKEEENVEAQPESPPPSLEKVSEDIDQFLVTLQNNNKDDTKLEIPKCVITFLDLVEQKITKYDTAEAKWGESAEEDSLFLESVNRVSNLMKHLTEYIQSHREKEQEDEEKVKVDLMINGIGSIQQRAMSFLEEEFRSLMEESRNPNKADPKGKQHVAEALESETPTETVMDFPGFAEETVTKLRQIAKEMTAGGYENECCQVYAVSRRHAFEEGLYKILGYEKLSIDEAQRMPWETLEREIPTWINTWKECTSVWFPGERKLAEAVFAEETTADSAACLYGNLFRSIAIQLVNFAESVAMTKRAGEKLFKLLDMYETLRDAIPSMENLFPDDMAAEVKTETTSAKCRLGEGAVLIFCDLENSIKSETGRTPVAGGAVHPLTRYIMNYLRLACEYKDTLEEVFKEHSKMERADSTSRPHYEREEDKHKNNAQKDNVSPFAAQLMRVMELLDSNLEGKAKLYKEVALSCIFMMNNGRYIVQKIKGSAEIYEVMGETWCRKRSTELRTYHKTYQLETWSKILSCLSLKGLNDNGKVQKPVLKERFKSFNALFEEIHKTQSAWVVSDEQLQSELRASISTLVIPAYRSFLGRFSQYLDPGRQTEKYIKYQGEDVETCIDELFDGNPHGRR
ncbi:exocyst complex component EXO70B1 [Cajanus cajan]|uniref:Exocyst subunit Exo70 family protein n=1 Tax=Cajanus cajan TaxID=3821 RepID=A0A151QWD5_CAJCA|nr:exocyst complex component EXO70B1 [Cajanus cajan]KYP34586.1 Exocyst complex component 7 [Cajanus cajan]